MLDNGLLKKYADPVVVGFWQKLGEQGLQQAEQAMIGRYLPGRGHLLDLGCGAGRAALALSAQNYAVTGIDLSLSMLRAGRTLSAALPLSGANLLNLPFETDSFSAAFMFFGALQHIRGRSNRQQALAEMARVVQPDGRLILGLDNLAPALACYVYWLAARLRGRPAASSNGRTPSTSAADQTLWQPRGQPLLWHGRGLARTLRWRTWPGLVDLARAVWPLSRAEPGDVQVAQFSQPATPGRVYYHLYRAEELIDDAAAAGWRLLGGHAGRELSEGSTYPPRIRALDKQLFFAFQRD